MSCTEIFLILSSNRMIATYKIPHSALLNISFYFLTHLKAFLRKTFIRELDIDKNSQLLVFPENFSYNLLQPSIERHSVRIFTV